MPSNRKHRRCGAVPCAATLSPPSPPPSHWLRCVKPEFFTHLVPQKTPFLRFPRLGDVTKHGHLATNKNPFTDLPKIFSSRIALKTKHLPVYSRITPSRTTPAHVMFESAFANLSSPQGVRSVGGQLFDNLIFTASAKHQSCLLAHPFSSAGCRLSRRRNPFRKKRLFFAFWLRIVKSPFAHPTILYDVNSS